MNYDIAMRETAEAHLVLQPGEVEEPGGAEDVYDGVRADQPGEQLAGQLGEAGQQEHVGRVQQLRHHLLRHLARVRVHEGDHAAEY